MERCPGCNARTIKKLTCPRCRTDLSGIVLSEQWAHYWLAEAIQYAEKNNTELCLSALYRSLNLKKSRLATVFRDFLIHQQCNRIVDLLAKKQFIAAKKTLVQTRMFIPVSKPLQQLNSLTDFLMVKQAESSID